MNTEKLISDLKIQEGFRGGAYECPTGYITIGYGHNLQSSNLPAEKVKLYLQRGITSEEAEILLKIDVAGSIEKVFREMPWISEKPEAVQIALCNMCFQLGFNGLSKFKKMIAALQEDRFCDAVAEAYDSRWARQTPSRTEYVAELFRACM